HDLYDLLIGFPFFPAEHLSVRHDKFHLSGFPDHAYLPVFSPALSRPEIFRISPYLKDLVLIGKGILYIGVRPFLRILAPHHISVSSSAAGTVIERICDRIKNGGLSRSGVSRHQEEASRYI